ncbi:DUF4263 domain-containing protein [Mucilaginibacter sp. cycad4]|uniref:Shedu anti-phage system protein SduA domain-containing protein n=1 Tax=Mucilaginibacter sp. cycad4 TaxID=3342096 RepID=UPI002AAC4814|nr:Shedu anti-phage system protein SduA domain-containing protein [Mucilaginibacter gossypii]WPV01649.1 DUF4263 domain-containing protein [Mucilaginibacter gossypii]
MAKPASSVSEMASTVFKFMSKFYSFPLYQYLKENPELIKTFPGFLLNPDQIVLYFGKNHLAIEYTGPEHVEEIRESSVLPITWHDYTNKDADFFESIVGFTFSDGNSTGIKMHLPEFTEDLILPTDKGFDKLLDLNWNFDAQNSMLGINSSGFTIPEKRFGRMVNSLFFDADENGLKTRHIKWIDFLPLIYDETDPEVDKFSVDIGFMKQLVPIDAKYVYPSPPKSDYKYSKLPQLNRFIELVGNHNTTEPEITRFLSLPENKFILTMGILSNNIFDQLECEWQSESHPAIIPDFFVLRPNGYADIVEFKLPTLKGGSVVGKANRETFSAEINSYISQTRNYRKYFEDPNNRSWFKNNYSFDVLYPKRILIVGRRWHFSTSEWKEICNDYRDLEILTYDDVIDGVQAQFYL